jgi:hypothetical protein
MILDEIYWKGVQRSHGGGDVRDPPSNTTSAWSMLSSTANNQTYAQIGVKRGFGEPSNSFFYEFKGNNGAPPQLHVLFGVSNGTNRFWVQLVPPADGIRNWHLRLNIDNTIQGYTWWDPFSATGFNSSKAYPVWSGETHYLGTDIMGSTYSPTTFDSLTVQQFTASGAEYWRPQYSGDNTRGATPGGYRYGFAWTYSDSFKIWTYGT